MNEDRPHCYFIPSEHLALHFARRPSVGTELVRAAVSLAGLATIGFGLVLFAAVFAEASCRWEFDCSHGYPCRQVQLCDRAFDMPVIRPPAISPIPPPSIAPIPTPTIPMIGTQSCRQAHICDNYGRCSWKTVCQ